MGRKFDFPQKVTKLAWSLAERVPGKDPNRWRCDAVGVPVLKALRSKNLGLAAYVFDHRFGPSSDVEKGNPFFRSIKNCQLLSTMVNLRKRNNNKITRQQLMGYRHNLMLTSAMINLLELSAYGNVKNENGQILHECYTVEQALSELIRANPASTPPDKTLALLIERFPSSNATRKEREEFTKEQIMEIAWTEHVKRLDLEQKLKKLAQIVNILERTTNREKVPLIEQARDCLQERITEQREAEFSRLKKERKKLITQLRSARKQQKETAKVLALHLNLEQKRVARELHKTEEEERRKREDIARGSEAEPPREPAAAPAAAAAAAAPSSPAPAPTPRSTSSTSNSEA